MNVRFTQGPAPKAPLPEPEEKPESGGVQQLFWTGEPTDITTLLQTYQVEAKIPGKFAGTTLYVMDTKNRSSNKAENVTEDQTYKLFLVPRQNYSLMLQIFESFNCVPEFFQS